jgi:hypothetical protein
MWTVSLLMGLSLSGCQAIAEKGPQEDIPTIEIGGLTIQNHSFGMVSEVMLLVIKTDEFISCGNIAFRGVCSTRFPLRQYQGNKIEIKWKQGGSEWSTGEFVVEASDKIDLSRPAYVRVQIISQGLAPTDLIQ